MLRKHFTFIAAAFLAAAAMPAVAGNAGTWMVDQNGCGVWNSDPKPQHTVTWTGDCVNGRAQGIGTLKGFAGGKLIAHYTGEMDNGQMNGQGIFTDDAGNKYQGHLVNGEPHGHGTFIEAGGNTYTGAFRNGMKNGQGTETAPNGNKFTGEFRNNKMWNGVAVVKANGQRVRITNGRLPNGKSAN